MFGPGAYRPDPTEGITAIADLPPPEIVPYGVPRKRRKTELFWSRIRHKQTSRGFYGIGTCHTLVYQRLARGLCCFMNNPG